MRRCYITLHCITLHYSALAGDYMCVRENEIRVSHGMALNPLLAHPPRSPKARRRRHTPPWVSSSKYNSPVASRAELLVRRRKHERGG